MFISFFNRYLEREKKTQLDNTTTYELYWGERAKHEIDKQNLITFLAEVFNHVHLYLVQCIMVNLFPSYMAVQQKYGINSLKGCLMTRNSNYYIGDKNI